MIMPMIKLRLRRVVVDVDTQQHFFEKNSLVCVRDHRRVLANILKVINWAHIRNIPRISTVQRLEDSRCWCAYCMACAAGERKVQYTVRGRFHSYDADDGTDLLPGLLDRYEQIIFHKRCYDPFDEPRTDRMLSELRADEFILVGAAAEGAVKATALGLLSRGKKVTVPVDAVGSYNDFAGRLTLRQLAERGANLTETKNLLASYPFHAVRTHDFIWA